MPCLASQKRIASKNEPLRVLTNRSDHVRPPSVVRKMRDESPMLIANATRADVAATERRSSAAAPGTLSTAQSTPPFVV